MAPYSDSSVIVSTLVALFIFIGVGLYGMYDFYAAYHQELVLLAFLGVTFLTPPVAWLLRSLVCNWLGEALFRWWKFWANH